MPDDVRAAARRLAGEAPAAGRPLDWFEPLYAATWKQVVSRLPGPALPGLPGLPAPAAPAARRLRPGRLRPPLPHAVAADPGRSRSLLVDLRLAAGFPQRISLSVMAFGVVAPPAGQGGRYRRDLSGSSGRSHYRRRPTEALDPKGMIAHPAAADRPTADRHFMQWSAE
ncbi:hypothetical protein FAIPA1_150072 [Frankia sp. AiPs1]